jgi:hypothetical protein
MCVWWMVRAGVCGDLKVQVCVMLGGVVRDGMWVQVHVITGRCRCVRRLNCG